MLRLLRLLAATSLVVAVLGLSFLGLSGSPGSSFATVAQAALPQPSASGGTCPGGICVGAGGGTPTPGASDAGGGSCTWGSYPFVILSGSGKEAVWGPTGLSTSEEASLAGWTAANDLWTAGTPLYTNFDIVYCPDPHVVSAGLVGVVPGITPTAGNVLGLWAYSQVSWTPPSLGTSPPLSAAAVVNLPTYLYVNPGAYQATGTTATVPGGAVSATIVATPVKVVWTTDGESVTCPGQGVPYNSAWGNSPAPAGSGACTYTYSDTSADQPGGTYSLSATVWYHATWTSTGAGGAAGDLGLVPGPTVTEQITVDQIASVITTG